jgi:hypothetical protein
MMKDEELSKGPQSRSNCHTFDIGNKTTLEEDKVEEGDCDTLLFLFLEEARGRRKKKGKRERVS